MCNSTPFLDDYHEVFRTEFIIELYGLYPNSLHLDPTFFSQEKIHHYGTYAASNSFEARAGGASSSFHSCHMYGNILHLLKLHPKISGSLLKGPRFSQTSP